MSNEPNQQMESLLREAAKKRAAEAGGPFELHPVNRRVLQDEVARTFPSAKPAPLKPGWSELLMALLPRLALGVGIFVVLGITVYLTLPQSPNRGSSFELSKMEPAAAPESRRGSPDQAAPRPLAESLPSDKAALADQVMLAPAAPPSASGGQLAGRSEGLSKAKTGSASDVSLAGERDANFAFQEKAMPALRSRAVSPEAAAGSGVSKDAVKEAARADAVARGLDAGKPAAQPASIAAPAPTLAGGKQSGASLELAKKPPETEALAFKLEARKSDSTLNDTLARQQNANVSPPARQTLERKAALNAPARGQLSQSTTTTNGTVFFAGASAMREATDAQVSRLDFVRQDSRALYRRNLQSPPLPKVLTQFSASIADGRITLTDVDGSVYSGLIVSGGATGGVRFQASGTNQRSGQKLTIDGTLDAAPGKVELAAKNEVPTNVGRVTGSPVTDAGVVAAGQLLRGRVTVGGTQFEIQAVRVSSPP